MATPFNSIEEAIKDIKKGKFIILVDDEDRENEGDLVMAAGKVTPQAVNFMAKHARGLICLALTPERVEELQLTPQAAENTATFGTAFTVSIDARKGITTGISAADRATTIHVAIDPRCTPADLARPGHIFPLKAQVGGVLRRAGQTEGSVDLARLAGLALFRAGSGRVFNACDDSALRMGDYFDQVADALNLPRPPRVERSEAVGRLSPMTLSFMSESRRILNARVKRELRVRLRYPTITDGLRHLRER